jgi:hypothetical protein
MLPKEPLAVILVKLVHRIPMAQQESNSRRGRPKVYSDRLFLKALVVMVLHRLTKVHELISVLQQDTFEMNLLRELLTENGRFPSRRTWERRLKAMPDSLPAQTGLPGHYLLSLINPWESCGAAAATDSTALKAGGGVWHKKFMEKAEVPHSSIDTGAHWTKSGWHGWVYGWKLHLACTVASVWIPLAARLTPANVADNEQAPALWAELPEEVRFFPGDTSYNDSALIVWCEQHDKILVATRRGPHPHTDPGANVRRVLHELRHRAIVRLSRINGQFKGIFEFLDKAPTKGYVATERFVLGAVLVCQIALIHRFENGADLRVGLKPFLRAA